MNTTLTPQFPLELLKASAEARITHFTRFLANHSHLYVAREEAMGAINRSTGPRVVIVTGPSGTGKTTLARTIYRNLQLQYQGEACKDQGFIPVAGLSAVPPNGVSFNWKDFYVRVLSGHGDVMVDRKLCIPRQDDFFAEAASTTPWDRSVVDALRRSLEESLRRRRTRVLIIDEAHHLLMVNDPKRLEYQFETLKSLTIETQTTIVLVGTYKLLDIRDQSGQLVRRSEIVHLPRYDIRQKAGGEDFASLVHTLVAQLPLKELPAINADGLDYLYTKTGGCVGILKDWLARCLEDALKAKRKTFTLDDADRLSLPNKALRTIIEEAMVGEAKLQDENLDNIKALLYQAKVAPSQSTIIPPKKASRADKVGKRLPTRDIVGGLRHAASIS